MVTHASVKARSLRANNARSTVVQTQRKALAIAVSAIGALAVFTLYPRKRDPENTSCLTGEAWVQELLDGHPGRFHNAMGMHKHVFRRLVNELGTRAGFSATRWMTCEEQLAIFMWAAVTGVSMAHLKERFQRSKDTISRVINRMLNLLVSEGFYSAYVRLPSEDSGTPAEIRDDPKFYPFFEGCRGGVDGTHVNTFVLEELVARCRNRKGVLSQNVLAACSMDMRFTYILSGWEGSASDSQIFHAARESDFGITPGTYYLADAGFPSCDTLLVPYRGVRYHLKEWGTVGLRPQNYKELYNLRHSQARNVVERIFGVVKKRFRLLIIAPQYPYAAQTKFVPALAAVHNFIRIHDPHDYDHDSARNGRIQPSRHSVPPAENLGHFITPGESRRSTDRRDLIAKAMWNQYQETLAERQDV